MDEERGREQGGMRGKGTSRHCQVVGWRITPGLVIMPRRAQRQAATVWMSDHTYLPPVCLFPAVLFSVSVPSLARAMAPFSVSALSGPLCDINWPPTKGGKSPFTACWEMCYRNYCYRICRGSLQICHLTTWPQPAYPLSRIFINTHELIEENIWLVHVTVILLGKCDEFFVFIRISLTLV